MFQFPGFALSHESTWSSTKWVAPFRDARIKTCLQFPEPFRSLPRLSSPPDSLGILRSLFFSFSFFAPSFFRSLRQARPPVLTTQRLLRSSNFAFLDLGKNLAQIVNHIFLCLLLPIEIVVHNLLQRKFRIQSYRLIFSIFCFTSNLFSQYCQ